jgi:hypothetical protein
MDQKIQTKKSLKFEKFGCKKKPIKSAPNGAGGLLAQPKACVSKLRPEATMGSVLFGSAEWWVRRGCEPAEPRPSVKFIFFLTS